MHRITPCWRIGRARWSSSSSDRAAGSTVKPRRFGAITFAALSGLLLDVLLLTGTAPADDRQAGPAPPGRHGRPMRTTAAQVIFGTGAMGVATFAALCRREPESNTGSARRRPPRHDHRSTGDR